MAGIWYKLKGARWISQRVSPAVYKQKVLLFKYEFFIGHFEPTSMCPVEVLDEVELTL